MRTERIAAPPEIARLTSASEAFAEAVERFVREMEVLAEPGTAAASWVSRTAPDWFDEMTSGYMNLVGSAIVLALARGGVPVPETPSPAVTAEWRGFGEKMRVLRTRLGMLRFPRG